MQFAAVAGLAVGPSLASHCMSRPADASGARLCINALEVSRWNWIYASGRTVT
jgi:hypothetical protein